MIRHVAIFRFVSGFSEAEREQWMTLLRALPAQIPEPVKVSLATVDFEVTDAS